MTKNDFCQVCGSQKFVFVTTIHGNTAAVMPGNSLYIPKSMVDRWECACTECGLLYSLNSLASQVEIYE